MKIIPVIDLQNGVVVRGVAGQRDAYRPVQSQLTPSVEPDEVLRRLQQTYGLTDFYVADLDAIQRQRPDGCQLARLQQAEGTMYCDAGIRSLADALRIADLHVDQIVLGLESLPSPQVAAELLSAFGPERLVFSLDMHQSRPLRGGNLWPAEEIRDIFEMTADMGFRQFLVLDLSTVGMATGLSTLSVCRHIRHRLTDALVLCGGGVRTASDLDAARQAGADGVLVASALHQQTLRPAEVRRIQQGTDRTDRPTTAG